MAQIAISRPRVTKVGERTSSIYIHVILFAFDFLLICVLAYCIYYLLPNLLLFFVYHGDIPKNLKVKGEQTCLREHFGICKCNDQLQTVLNYEFEDPVREQDLSRIP